MISSVPVNVPTSPVLAFVHCPLMGISPSFLETSTVLGPAASAGPMNNELQSAAATATTVMRLIGSLLLLHRQCVDGAVPSETEGRAPLNARRIDGAKGALRSEEHTSEL